MSVIPPFGNNLGKLCIETEVIYSRVMTYTVLRYLQKQPRNRGFFVILSTISPSLSDNVISLTDVDFDDRVFSSSTHFVMFYGPW